MQCGVRRVCRRPGAGAHCTSFIFPVWPLDTRRRPSPQKVALADPGHSLQHRNRRGGGGSHVKGSELEAVFPFLVSDLPLGNGLPQKMVLDHHSCGAAFTTATAAATAEASALTATELTNPPKQHFGVWENGERGGNGENGRKWRIINRSG